MKTNYLKKCMSVLLSISMIASLFAVSFTASAEETLVVDGESYKIGDVVELKGDLQINNWLMNGQVEIPYDSSKLEFIDDEEVQTVEQMFPELTAQGIEVYYNSLTEEGSSEGEFLFNFSDPTGGVDFTSVKTLYDIKFRVIGAGTIENFAQGVNIVDMKSYNFEGSPEGHDDFTMVPVSENGKIIEGKGSIKNEVVTSGEPAEKTLTVDGKTYNVGDRFTFVGDLQANRWLMNTQLELEYDDTKLKIVAAEYPVLEAAGIDVYDSFNYGDAEKNEGFFTFNFSEPENGVSFIEEGELYKVTFEVIGTGKTDLSNNVNIVDMSVFPFDGDPADHVGEERYPVDIKDPSGSGIDSSYGTIVNAIKEDAPVEETLSVDGIEYKVGDMVNFNVDLETMKWIMNAQFELNFDDTKLAFVSADYPIVEQAGIEVVDNVIDEDAGTLAKPGFFTFNFTDVTDGVDFTVRNCLASLQFKVIGTGETSLNDGSKFVVLNTFNFEGSPSDPENQGVEPEPENILDKDGNLTEGNTAYYYYGNPTIVEGFTVNGQEVKAGDIVEYRVWVKNEENWLVNGEFDILYTNHYLEFLDVTYPGLTTIAGYVVDNHIPESGLTESQGKTAGELLFNFTNIHSGVDFTEGAYMAVFRFKVHESTDPNIPAQGASVIELNGNVVNDMYAFKFAGSGSSHSINEKQELDRLIGEDGLPTTDEFRLETEIIKEITVDVSKLQEAYDKWSQFDTTGYTEESVANLNKILEEAKKVLDDIAAGNDDPYTQEIIDKMATDVEEAGEALVVDKQPLIDLIEEATNDYLNDEDTLYMPETMEELEKAIEAAQAVVDDENATVQDVKDQIKAIEDAIKNLKKGAYLGDVNLSWSVDVVDATATQKFIVQIDPGKFYMVLADVNKDGKITVVDATMIQKIAAGLMEKEIVELPNL